MSLYVGAVRPRIDRAVRLVISLLVAMAAVTLVSCGGSDDEASAPLPVSQRFVSAEDAPGSKPDPVERRETTTDYAVFIPALREASINPDADELNAVFKADDFKSAGQDARFFGETHSSETSNHVFSSFIELSSEDAAASALDWLETDQMKPCPESCAVQRSSFDVDGIPDARGVHRVATADDIERVGNKDERPQDDYWIGFTNGSTVYTMVLHGHGGAGSVTEDQAKDIASAYYERLTAD
jgi:hypothetical protein